MRFRKSIICLSLLFFHPSLLGQESQAHSFLGFSPQRSVIYFPNTTEKIYLTNFSVSSNAKHYLFLEDNQLVVDGDKSPPGPSAISFAGFRPQSEDYYVLTSLQKPGNSDQNSSRVKLPTKKLFNPKKLKDHFLNESAQNSIFTLYKGENKIGEFDYLSHPVFSKDGKWMLATGFKDGKAIYVLNDKVIEADSEITAPIFNKENDSVSFFVKKGSKYLWMQNGETKEEFEKLFQSDPGMGFLFFAKKGKELYSFRNGKEELVTPWMEFDAIENSFPYEKATSFLVLKKQIQTNDKNKDLYNPTYDFYVAFPGKIFGPFKQVNFTDLERAYWVGQESGKDKLFFKDQLLQEASSISDFLFFQEKPLFIFGVDKQKYIQWGDQKWGPYSYVAPFPQENDLVYMGIKEVSTVVKENEYLLWKNGETQLLKMNVEGEILRLFGTQNPDKYFLLVKNEKGYQVVGPQQKSRIYENIIESVVPSLDGDHYAFVAKKWVGNEEKEFVVHDGIEDSPYLKISEILFLRNGKINYRAVKYKFEKLGDPHREIFIVNGQKMNAFQFEKLKRRKSIHNLYGYFGNKEGLRVAYEQGECKKATLVHMYFQSNIPFCEQWTKELLLVQNGQMRRLGLFDDLYSVFVSEDKKHLGVFALKDKKLYWIVEALNSGEVKK